MAKPKIPFALAYNPKQLHVDIYDGKGNNQIRIHRNSIPSLIAALRESHRQTRPAEPCPLRISSSAPCALRRKKGRCSELAGQPKPGLRKPETLSRLSGKSLDE